MNKLRISALPVLTWFPIGYPSYPQITRRGPLFAYLNGDLGFERSLIGNELAA